MDRANGLVTESIEAHGGLERWRALTSFTGRMTGGGPLFEMVGHPDAIRNVSFSASTREQEMRQWPMGGPDLRSIVQPARVALVNGAGETVQESDDPRGGYPPTALKGKLPEWNALNVAYFTGYAIWNYLMAPFLWTWPGVQTEQLEPVDGENGGRLRRLRVRYPADIATHSTEETFYFSDAGLIVRVDYAPEVTGNRPSANFASEHREVTGGIVMPTRRVIRPRNPDDIAADTIAIEVAFDRLEYI